MRPRASDAPPPLVWGVGLSRGALEPEGLKRGDTPVKRMAPSDVAEGQINPNQVPPDSHSQDPPAPKKAKVAKGKKAAAAVAPSSDSGSDSDSSAGSVVNPDTVVIDPPAKLAKMPSELGDDAAFIALYRARCARAWIASGLFENEAPASTRPALWRGRMWSTRDRSAYDKMIAVQVDSRSRGGRRENPLLVACPHRLTFSYADDYSVELEAKHIAMVCAGESLADAL